jgi:hypothetical protein
MLFTAVLFQSLMFIFLSLHGTTGTGRFVLKLYVAEG